MIFLKKFRRNTKKLVIYVRNIATEQLCKKSDIPGLSLFQSKKKKDG